MKKTESKNALIIGMICIAVYLSNYYLRNVLSVLTPRMLETGLFTVERIGALSSTYMILYAIGQLVNGFLGDFFSPKKLVTTGISLAGAACVAFPLTDLQFLHIFCFALLGFGLSMIRGPLMKIISENTKPNHARVICVFFSFASFAGPLIASLFALLYDWRRAFAAAGLVAFVVAGVVFCLFTYLERKQLLSYQSSKGQGISSIFSVFKIEKFVFYMLVTCPAEMCTSSIVFWIPAFLTNHLLFEKNSANMLYIMISALSSLMPFLTLVIFRACKEKDIPMLRVSFLTATVAFAAMLIAPNRWIAFVLFVAALMAMSCSSAMLWSIYIPGLGKTGKVSSVNGVLDCMGYASAAIANLIFTEVLSKIGWNAVFVLWSVIGAVGLIATLFAKNRTETKA